MVSDWETLFDTCEKEDGASSEMIAEFVRTALQPLSADEVNEANALQQNPFPVGDPQCGVRAMMLAYQIPEYMPHAVPFAFDGAGTFYLFDMRQPPVDDEFPIVLSHAGSLGWDEYDHERIAEDFVSALLSSGPKE